MRGKSEVNTETVARIKAHLAMGYHERTIAEAYHISRHTVRDIRRGKTYKYVEPYHGEKILQPLACVCGTVKIME